MFYHKLPLVKIVEISKAQNIMKVVIYSVAAPISTLGG